MGDDEHATDFDFDVKTVEEKKLEIQPESSQPPNIKVNDDEIQGFSFNKPDVNSNNDKTISNSDEQIDSTSLNELSDDKQEDPSNFSVISNNDKQTSSPNFSTITNEDRQLNPIVSDELNNDVQNTSSNVSNGDKQTSYPTIQISSDEPNNDKQNSSTSNISPITDDNDQTNSSPTSIIPNDEEQTKSPTTSITPGDDEKTNSPTTSTTSDDDKKTNSPTTSTTSDDDKKTNSTFTSTIPDEDENSLTTSTTLNEFYNSPSTVIINKDDFQEKESDQPTDINEDSSKYNPSQDNINLNGQNQLTETSLHNNEDNEDSTKNKEGDPDLGDFEYVKLTESMVYSKPNEVGVEPHDENNFNKFTQNLDEKSNNETETETTKPTNVNVDNKNNEVIGDSPSKIQASNIVDTSNHETKTNEPTNLINASEYDEIESNDDNDDVNDDDVNDDDVNDDDVNDDVVKDDVVKDDVVKDDVVKNDVVKNDDVKNDVVKNDVAKEDDDGDDDDDDDDVDDSDDDVDGSYNDSAKEQNGYETKTEPKRVRFNNFDTDSYPQNYTPKVLDSDSYETTSELKKNEAQVASQQIRERRPHQHHQESELPFDNITSLKNSNIKVVNPTYRNHPPTSNKIVKKVVLSILLFSLIYFIYDIYNLSKKPSSFRKISDITDGIFEEINSVELPAISTISDHTVKCRAAANTVERSVAFKSYGNQIAVGLRDIGDKIRKAGLSLQDTYSKGSSLQTSFDVEIEAILNRLNSNSNYVRPIDAKYFQDRLHKLMKKIKDFKLLVEKSHNTLLDAKNIRISIDDDIENGLRDAERYSKNEKHSATIDKAKKELAYVDNTLSELHINVGNLEKLREILKDYGDKLMDVSDELDELGGKGGRVSKSDIKHLKRAVEGSKDRHQNFNRLAQA